MTDLATPIPADRLACNPLIGDEGWLLLQSLLSHPDAPRWNRTIGDRITTADLDAIDWFRRQLPGSRQWSAHGPTPTITTWVSDMLTSVPFHRDRVLEGLNPARSWSELPAMSRQDIAASLGEIIPVDAPLDQLITFRTAGTRGRPLSIPHHPRSVVADHALLEATLADHGIRLETSPDVVAVAHLRTELDPAVYATVLSTWGDAAMVSVNLRPEHWLTGIEGARRFFIDLEAQVISGEPAALLEARAWDLAVEPLAVLSTGSALRPGTAARLREHFRCPVIDWYSLTETGPIASSTVSGKGLRLLSGDLYVEIVDAHGRPVRPGTFGEIAVTGGRNPYLPLIRYRTGDFGRLDRVHGEPRLLDLRGRSPVLFRDHAGSAVHPTDVGQALTRVAVFVRHQVVQESDGSIRVAIEPAEGMAVNWEALQRTAKGLFGDVRIVVESDTELGGAEAYRTEIAGQAEDPAPDEGELDDVSPPESAPGNVDPGPVLVDPHIAGQAEDPLADDVPHDL